MSDKHKIGSDGLRDDGVRTDQATPQDFMLYGQAQQALSQWSAPVLLHADNAHERLAIINMDGTGNDAVHDPDHITNVGLFNKELEFLSKANPHIHAIYETGPGTQKNVIVRMADGAIGYTYDAHLEHAYKQFIEQANKWLMEDPRADIRVAITGFSRGGDEAAGLARLIHERGIQDWKGMMVRHHLIGHDTITYTKPPLIPPGKTLQAVMLLDPVGTGVPYRRDRQLPPSVVSGLQITARDERRDAFASSEIIPNGLSADGRFLQVTVPGAHSDIGGSYHRNGLSTLNYNLAADYLNALSDTPLLHKRVLPQDPQMYVIHHSEDHEWFYAATYVSRHGERALRGAQHTAPDCRATIACLPPEPLDPSLAATLQTRHAVTTGPVPQASASVSTQELGNTAVDDLSSRLDRTIKAADAGDRTSFHQDHQALADIAPGRELFSHAKTMTDLQEQHAARQPSLLPAPPHLDDPVHPDHALYQQARSAVHQLDAEHHRMPDHRSDQLAAALVVAARRDGLTRIDAITVHRDGEHVSAWEKAPPAADWFTQFQISTRHAAVPIVSALNTPIAHSSLAWEQTMQKKQIDQAKQELQRQQQPAHQQNHGISR